MATVSSVAQQEQKAHRRARFWRENFTGYMFVMPVVLGLIIWTFGPMIASAYYSLTEYNVVGAPEFVGFRNFEDLFGNDRLFKLSIEVTFNYAWRFIIVGQITSLLFAVLLTQKVRFLAFFRTVYYMPIVVPFVASSLLWRYLFNNQYGPLNSVLEFFGLDSVNWLGSPDWALNSLVIMGVWGSAVSTIIYVAGLQNIPLELHEAAKIDGANAVRRFYRVTIPLLTPTIFFNVVTNVIATFQYFVPAFIMTEGGPARSTYFYNLNLYDKAFSWLQMGYASAMAWVMFGIIIVSDGVDLPQFTTMGLL